MRCWVEKQPTYRAAVGVGRLLCALHIPASGSSARLVYQQQQQQARPSDRKFWLALAWCCLPVPGYDGAHSADHSTACLAGGPVLWVCSMVAEGAVHQLSSCCQTPHRYLPLRCLMYAHLIALTNFFPALSSCRAQFADFLSKQPWADKSRQYFYTREEEYVHGLRCALGIW